jgi:hypothetical protein
MINLSQSNLHPFRCEMCDYYIPPTEPMGVRFCKHPIRKDSLKKGYLLNQYDVMQVNEMGCASNQSQDIGLIGIAKINDRLRLLYPDDFALQLNEKQLEHEQKEHDAAIARAATLAENKRVLDAIIYYIKEWETGYYGNVSSGWLNEKIESLRTAAQEPHRRTRR